MTCPLYNDFTRDCIKTFEALVDIYNYDYCDSDESKDCLFYHIITDKDKICKYIDICISKTLEIPGKALKLSIEKANMIGKEYCRGENRVNCIQYKAMESGKEVSLGDLPDGSKMGI